MLLKSHNMNSYKEEHPLFVKCDCGADLLEVRRFSETFDKEKSLKDEGFYFTFWSYGRSNYIMRWKDRFRWCWRILRTGDPWADGIIASNANAKLISEYINQHINNEKL